MGIYRYYCPNCRQERIAARDDKDKYDVRCRKCFRKCTFVGKYNDKEPLR